MEYNFPKMLVEQELNAELESLHALEPRRFAHRIQPIPNHGNMDRYKFASKNWTLSGIDTKNSVNAAAEYLDGGSHYHSGVGLGGNGYIIVLLMALVFGIGGYMVGMSVKTRVAPAPTKTEYTVTKGAEINSSSSEAPRIDETVPPTDLNYSR